MKGLKAILICIGLLALTAMVFVLISMEVLPQGYYGCTRNSLSSTVSCDNIYEPGRYVIGPFTSFLPVPSTLVTVDFSKDSVGPVECFDSSASPLRLEVSFQYRLQKGRIESLIRQHTTVAAFHEIIMSRARSIIGSVASNYQQSDFFEKRQEISEDMRTSIEKESSSEDYLIPLFQLREIGIVSQANEDAIIEIQVSRQRSIREDFVREKAQIDAQTRNIVTEFQAQIQVVEASAEAEAYNIRKNAEAEAVRLLNQAEVSVYEDIKTMLGLDPNDLVDYLQLDAYSEKKDAFLVAGQNTAIVNIN
ncbi:hypothetical protein GEMRC1_008985 [Eukaryota sp. GEM-RC1]